MLIRSAQINDIDQLLRLYYEVYGRHYPLTFGTDAEAAEKMLRHERNRWLLATSDNGQIIASCVFEVDSKCHLGRVQGLAIHPTAQGQGLATRIVKQGIHQLFEQDHVSSIYCTTRTLVTGPQIIFLRLGFLALGIFPNAHKLEDYETLTLMAQFKADVIEARSVPQNIPQALLPIYKILHQSLGIQQLPQVIDAERCTERNQQMKFEIIFAPDFVLRQTSAYLLTYPFHLPNTIISASSGDIDLFAHLNSSDGSLAVIGSSAPLHHFKGQLRNLFRQLRDKGISYIEMLVKADDIDTIHLLLSYEFLPSAIYPAMLKTESGYVDHVLMTRSMEPLDFEGIHVEKSFKPYLDAYVELWKKRHLDVLGVFDETRMS